MTEKNPTISFMISYIYIFSFWSVGCRTHKWIGYKDLCVTKRPKYVSLLEGYCGIMRGYGAGYTIQSLHRKAARYEPDAWLQFSVPSLLCEILRTEDMVAGSSRQHTQQHIIQKCFSLFP